ncbi:unnamed protein product, partial [Sphagnum jensenii]
MGRPQRYRGVRQRHWGSWVSEIRHPLLKTRVWLGTFETAEDAAHAYDEAARLICGSHARTNFPLQDPPKHAASAHDTSSPKSQPTLSATLSAKLHRGYLASQQQQQEHQAHDQRKVEFGTMSCNISPRPPAALAHEDEDAAASLEAAAAASTENISCMNAAEEDKFASEMIEELLGRNCGGRIEL